jgi:hypothetical protein
MFIAKSDLSSQKEYVQQRQPFLYSWYCELEKILSNPNLESTVPSVSWGLIGQGLLLEGEDKDAYLHFLEWVAETQGMHLILIKHNAVPDLTSQISSIENPVILFLEPGEWLDGESPADDVAALRRQVLDTLDIVVGKKIIVTSICQSYGDIAQDFRYRGKFDRHITWSNPDPDLYAVDFINMIGTQYLSNEIEVIKRRLGSLLCIEFPSFRRLGMLSVTLQRKSHIQSCAIQWRDILAVAIHGTGEGQFGNPLTNFDQIAAHEAGHAVATIVESDWKNIPDWVSILPGKDMIGIMVEDYEKTYDSSSFPTFLQVRSSIRIALAGRVAEELLLGELNVGSSCANEDLRDATYKAMHLISKNGFSASYGEGEYVGDGLLVGYKDYVPANSEYFQAQAREFIKRQYQVVKKTLQDNLGLLERIQKKLIQERLLLQEDLVELCRDVTSNERLAA